MALFDPSLKGRYIKLGSEMVNLADISKVVPAVDSKGKHLVIQRKKSGKTVIFRSSRLEVVKAIFLKENLLKDN